MNPDHEAAIRASWADVASRAEVVAAAFHARLIERDPEARAHFAGVEPAAHQRRLTQVLQEMAVSLDEPERLVEVLVPLGRRHASYGVREEQFAEAGDALVEALRETLGVAFTAEVEEAWRELVDLVAAVMRRAIHARL
ncbi:MAG TPA: globin domain-containing protein [Gemmatimonadales bacterium]|nr:globin domain-containing protein [Gemmatimonadales bacterium]